jgi:DNA polymerase
VAQLKDWLALVGLDCESLNKATVGDLVKKATDPTTKRVLELRQLLGKTSTTKYQAMIRAACADGRIRGITQYYGAARTGRWAGRLVQLQNLPQNHLDDIDKVREIVRGRDLDTLELLYDSVPDVLSQLIRTALVAKPGHTFLVSDYAAIEARVIAYLAGEQWRMDVFAEGGDIYCSSASQMFKVPVVKHGVNGHLRQKGKIAELACGYGGGVGALKAFGADKMGLTDEEMQDIVTQWRQASPTIPKFWGDTERAAKQALQNPGRTFTLPCGVKYMRDADGLRCRLPSGRVLTYWGARIEEYNNRPSVVFMGQNQTTRKWERMETWGGKLVENIVQAYARDCLAVALVRLDEAGYKIVFHVHDEIIAEEPLDGRGWEDMAEIMGRPIDWAPGLLLRGDGYATTFYMKD